jgi:hypothetical protein
MVSRRLKCVAVASIASSTTCYKPRFRARFFAQLTRLTSSPERITRRQLLMTCQLVFGAGMVCLRVILGRVPLTGVFGVVEVSLPFFNHLWIRRTMTAVVVLRPRPSWSLSTMAVRSRSVLWHNSSSSVRSWNWSQLTTYDKPHPSSHIRR